MITAKKNAAYYLSFPAIDSATPASYKSGVSPVDTAYYKDGAGVWTSLAITDTATEIGSTGVYEIDLTAAELNHDKVIIKFSVSGMADDAYQFDLKSKLVDDLNDVATTDIVSGGAINTTAGAVDNVILAATCTTNTDMRGTDNAATEAKQDIIDGIVDGILVDTGTTLPATLATIAGYIDTEIGTLITNLGAVDTVVDGIQTDLSNGVDGLGALKALIDTLDTVADAVKAKTDQLTFTKALELDTNVQSINGEAISGDGKTTPYDIV